MIGFAVMFLNSPLEVSGKQELRMAPDKIPEDDPLNPSEGEFNSILQEYSATYS